MDSGVVVQEWGLRMLQIEWNLYMDSTRIVSLFLDVESERIYWNAVD